jgi:hypothetical protein
MAHRLFIRALGSLLGISWALGAQHAHAKPAHLRALADYFGSSLPAKLNACTTCHLSAKPTEDEHAHNAFGKRLAGLRGEWKQAGKKADIITRILAIADEDSDGDGVANILELLSGHNPGDAKDTPNAKEVVAARKSLESLRASKAGHAWKPFDAVQRPAVPTAAPSWGRNAIDGFIAAEHEKRGLTHRPEAAKHVLLRRVYLDLIGLPPTREELHAFLADESPNAYEKVVDHLLASPRYGERWGRHWMDVWRYSDWAGFGDEVRESHRHVWHWRDWIVESLNADKGYDRMILEMLAGDEIAPTDPDTLRATGFLVRPWFVFNRNTWLDNVVEHTAKAFLGVTLNCARCHEHKYDPIEQEEYYHFRAFFEPYHVRTDRVPGQPDLIKGGIPRAFDAYLDAKTYIFEHGNEAHPDKTKPLSPAVPVALGGRPLAIRPIALPLTAYRPDKREFVLRETLELEAGRIISAKADLARARSDAASEVARALAPPAIVAAPHLASVSRVWTQIERFEVGLALTEAQHAALVPTVRAEQLEDSGKKGSPEWEQAAVTASRMQRREKVAAARAALLHARLLLADARDKAKPDLAKSVAAATEQLAKAEAELKKADTTSYTPRVPTYPQAPPRYGQTSSAPYPQTTTGRRLALARWIADSQNPLTARVAMNHVWLRHFGKPLVPTVFDFGGNGQPPSHPALLDWLAAEFMERGWSMKRMHRFIVTSAAYRMESNGDPEMAAKDPDNVYLWRMNSRRMEAETVRDSVLHVAGQLDSTMGGPEIDQNLGLTSRRRSVYLRHAAEKQMEFLLLFDAASVTECYRRVESVVPQQALALANSTLSQAQARLLARKLASQAGDPAAFVRLGFEHVLGRLPTEAEQRDCERFLTDQATLLADRAKLSAFTSGPASSVPPSADPTMRAREDLIHVLMNHNEFVTIR